MGGFSAQSQFPQSSAPAGKGAGMSSMQMGMDPIEQSPQDRMMKMQELQMEQPDQIPSGMQGGGQMGSLGGGMGDLGGGMQNPYQSNLNSANSRLLGGPVQQNPMMETPDPMSAQPVQQANNYASAGGSQPSQGKGSNQSQNIGYPQSAGMMGGQVTLPSQGGQPQLGMPNAYSNTMQPWDNQAKPQSGGAKGFGSASQSAKPMGKGA